MLESYSAIYRDHLGEETTFIRNDGDELRMTLRGIEFRSEDDIEWEPCESDPSRLSLFRLNIPSEGVLCDYTLEWDMPVTVMRHNVARQDLLHIQYTLSAPLPNGVCQGELSLSLPNGGQTFTMKGIDFEWAFSGLQKQFPEGMYLRTCFFCALSCYHPYRGTSFRNLGCFRKSKDQYSSDLPLASLLRTRQLKLFAEQEQEWVQVTYCCPEFISQASFSQTVSERKER